jgi:2-oxoisovalerate ferredoxin oxidoreductase delta subunit
MNQVLIKEEMCKGCQFCVKACPKNLIQPSGKLNLNGFTYVTYKGAGCTGCGFCFYACPELDAIEVHAE